MKKLSSLLLKNLVTLIIVSAISVCLVLHPKFTVTGIKNGFELLGNNLIPALFPFMVLSSYVSKSDISQFIKKLFEKPFRYIFKTNGYGIMPFVMGLLGGYPIGAKLINDFNKEGKITQNETERLFYWCINPSPAFTITAVGTFMLGNTQSGFILYASCVLASLTVGFFCRFITDDTYHSLKCEKNNKNKNIFVKSVSDAGEAMLSVCGWMLTFSVISAFCDGLIFQSSALTLIKSVAEVTLGCKNASETGLSLPIIAGILSFGGLAVICQCLKYSTECGVKPKFFICARLINAALSSLYCSFIIKLFPGSQEVVAIISTSKMQFTLYHSTAATIILLIMCILLILEVDNRKKVC